MVAETAMSEAESLSIYPRLELLQVADTVAVTCFAADDQGVVSVNLSRSFNGGAYTERPMFDDGLHGDGNVNDGTYGAFIAPRPAGTWIRYYVTALDTFRRAHALDPDDPTILLELAVVHERQTRFPEAVMWAQQAADRDPAAEEPPAEKPAAEEPPAEKPAEEKPPAKK